MPSLVKEALVVDYFNKEASVDEIANAYAYMNCIALRDYSNMDEYINDILPSYIVLESWNDGIERGKIIQWNIIEKYIDNILTDGAKDDVECLYCYLTDKY